MSGDGGREEREREEQAAPDDVELVSRSRGRGSVTWRQGPTTWANQDRVGSTRASRLGLSLSECEEGALTLKGRWRKATGEVRCNLRDKIIRWKPES